MAYGIMRTEKRQRQAVGGLQAEANRDAAHEKNFGASEIDWDRTADNVRLVSSDNWLRDINQSIADANITRVRKDAIVMLDTVYTASPEFFEGMSKEDTVKYFCHCLAFHKQELSSHIINAVIHFDESTPHMHICSVPITNDNRLSARDIMGGKADYHHRQDRFYELVSKAYGLERGEVKDYGKEVKHKSQLQHKCEQLEAQIADLERELTVAEQITTVPVKKPFIGKNVNIPYDELQAYRTAMKFMEEAREIKHSADSLLSGAEAEARSIRFRAKQDAEKIVSDATKKAHSVDELSAKVQLEHIYRDYPEIAEHCYNGVYQHRNYYPSYDYDVPSRHR